MAIALARYIDRHQSKPKRVNIILSRRAPINFFTIIDINIIHKTAAHDEIHR